MLEALRTVIKRMHFYEDSFVKLFFGICVISWRHPCVLLSK